MTCMMNGRTPFANLTKRFYKTVSVSGEEGDGWRILLDGRVVKTPLRATLALPTEALAQAIAREWEAQSDKIVPKSMPLTRLANTALDAVRGREAEVAADILSFAGRDLVCYRAEAPEELVARQNAAWQPVLQWVETYQLGSKLIVTTGIMPVDQPVEALAAMKWVFSHFDAFALSALHVMTTLTGSAVLTLALAHGQLSVDECWTAAHVDEDFQIAKWGLDAEASARREARRAEMNAAAEFLLLRNAGVC
jgi:chaperone required for assembly of F1-ATPase